VPFIPFSLSLLLNAVAVFAASSAFASIALNEALSILADATPSST